MTGTTQIGGWLFTIVALLAPGVVAMIFWAPFFASDRITALFRALPPRDSVGISYVLFAMLASIPFLVGFVIALIATPTNPPENAAPLSDNLLTLAVYLTGGYTLAVPILGAAILPELGVDWDPTDYGPSTWVLLGVAGLWYGLVFAIPLFIFSLVLAFPA